MGPSIKITSKYTGNIEILGIKIRENIRDLRAIRGKRKIKKFTTDNTEIHGFKIHGSLCSFLHLLCSRLRYRVLGIHKDLKELIISGLIFLLYACLAFWDMANKKISPRSTRSH